MHAANIIPIDNSYWVIPGRFMAGEYPGALRNSETRARLRWLLSQGIDMIIDLTRVGDNSLRPYETLWLEEASKVNKEVSYRSKPIQDFDTPLQGMMVDLLDMIDAALSSGKNIYVHCFIGRGRTGTAVGCYLSRHGITGEDALIKIQQLRCGIPGADKASPETAGQRKMVQEWIKGQ